MFGACLISRQFCELWRCACQSRVLPWGRECTPWSRCFRWMTITKALRLVLHTISTSAARYGRYIHPLMSLSIDFYIRLFVRVHAAPIEVKKAFRCALFFSPPWLNLYEYQSKTSTYYVCSGCQSFHGQALGKVVDKVNENSGNVNLQYKTTAGPTVSQHCEECGGTFHVCELGVIWSRDWHFPGRRTNVVWITPWQGLHYEDASACRNRRG